MCRGFVSVNRIYRIPTSYQRRTVFAQFVASALPADQLFHEEALDAYLRMIITDSVDRIELRRLLVDHGVLIRKPGSRIYRRAASS